MSGNPFASPASSERSASAARKSPATRNISIKAATKPPVTRLGSRVRAARKSAAGATAQPMPHAIMNGRAIGSAYFIIRYPPPTAPAAQMT